MANGDLPSFQRFYDASSIYTTDAGDMPVELLEPWIHWPTVHCGVPCEEHRVRYLGDGRTISQPGIAALLSDAGIRVGVSLNDDASLRGAVRFGYRRMDALIGRIVAENPNALLILCSALSQQRWFETTKCCDGRQGARFGSIDKQVEFRVLDAEALARCTAMGRPSAIARDGMRPFQKATGRKLRLIPCKRFELAMPRRADVDRTCGLEPYGRRPLVVEEIRLRATGDGGSSPGMQMILVRVAGIVCEDDRGLMYAHRLGNGANRFLFRDIAVRQASEHHSRATAM